MRHVEISNDLGDSVYLHLLNTRDDEMLKALKPTIDERFVGDLFNENGEMAELIYALRATAASHNIIIGIPLVLKKLHEHLDTYFNFSDTARVSFRINVRKFMNQ